MTLDNAAVDSFRNRWYVAQVRGGTEKNFAWNLSDHRIAYFLPLESLKVMQGDRRRLVHRAVFGGYCFINGGSAECYLARDLGAYHVIQDLQVLSVAMQSQLRRELRSLHLALQQNPTISKPLGVGTPVRIVRGALEGVEGRVIAHKHGVQLVLTVTMLGREVPVEIDPSFVEAA